MYLIYVGDTFSIFDSINDATEFQTGLNSLHSSLLFTMEVKNDCNLPFLDFLVECKNGSFITIVYSKPKSNLLYNNRNSLVPKFRKINFISTLDHRTLICSSCEFNQDHEKIHFNSTDDCFQITVIERKIKRLKKPTVPFI